MSSAFCLTSCSTQSPTAMRLSMGSKGWHYIYPPPRTHTHTSHTTYPPSEVGGGGGGGGGTMCQTCMEDKVGFVKKGLND